MVSTGRPVQIVAIQANTATALGMAMTKEAPLKNDSAMIGQPVANMWCSQTPKPSTIVETVARATTRISDQRSPAEGGQRLRHHAHRRQDDNVDPRMGEDPEQVLPQQRSARPAWGS